MHINRRSVLQWISALIGTPTAVSFSAQEDETRQVIQAVAAANAAASDIARADAARLYRASEDQNARVQAANSIIQETLATKQSILRSQLSNLMLLRGGDALLDTISKYYEETIGDLRNYGINSTYDFRSSRNSTVDYSMRLNGKEERQNYDYLMSQAYGYEYSVDLRIALVSSAFATPKDVLERDRLLAGGNRCNVFVSLSMDLATGHSLNIDTGDEFHIHPQFRDGTFTLDGHFYSTYRAATADEVEFRPSYTDKIPLKPSEPNAEWMGGKIMATHPWWAGIHSTRATSALGGLLGFFSFGHVTESLHLGISNISGPGEIIEQHDKSVTSKRDKPWATHLENNWVRTYPDPNVVKYFLNYHTKIGIYSYSGPDYAAGDFKQPFVCR